MGVLGGALGGFLGGELAGAVSDAVHGSCRGLVKSITNVGKINRNQGICQRGWGRRLAEWLAVCLSRLRTAVQSRARGVRHEKPSFMGASTCCRWGSNRRRRSARLWPHARRRQRRSPASSDRPVSAVRRRKNNYVVLVYNVVLQKSVGCGVNV